MNERIKIARNEAKLTQLQVASACGVAREAVTQWEAKNSDKRTTPSLENLITFAAMTARSLQWIVLGDDDSDPTIMIDDSVPAAEFWLLTPEQYRDDVSFHRLRMMPGEPECPKRFVFVLAEIDGARQLLVRIEGNGGGIRYEYPDRIGDTPAGESIHPQILAHQIP